MANVLTLRAEFDARGANESVREFNLKLSGIELSAIKASLGASKAIGGIDQAAVRVAASVKSSFSGLAAALVVAGIGALAKSTFELVAGFERSRIALKAFVGDTAKADALFKDIQTFAQSSPFQFKDLLEGGQRMLALGFAANEVLPALKAVSAASGAVGGSDATNNFSNVIHALGQIRAEGRVTGVTLNELGRNSIPALKYLADGFGTTEAAVKKAVEQGIVPADRAINVILRGMQSQFGALTHELEGSASVAVSNFNDTVQKLADDVAKDYLPAITKGIQNLTGKLGDIAAWAKDNKGEIESIATGIANIGIAIVTYKVAEGIQAVVAALGSVSLTSTPWGLIAAGIGFVGYETYKANAAFRDLQTIKLDDSVVQGLLHQGKTAKEIEELGLKAGMSADRIHDALKRISGGGDFGDAAKGLRDRTGISIVGDAAANAKPKIEQFDYSLRDAEETARKSAEANKRSAEILDKAQRGELTGLGKIVEEYRQYSAEIGITTTARENLAKAQALDLKSEALKEAHAANKEVLKGIEEEQTAQFETRGERFKAERQAAAQVLALRADNLRTEVGLQESAIVAQRDRELRGVELITAVTIAQKIAVEQKKAVIEQDYLRQSLDLKQQMLDVDQAIEVAKAGENQDLVFAIDKKYELARRALVQTNDADIAAAQGNAAIKTNQIVQDQNQKTFDSFKQQAEGVFDALIRTSTNGWSAIGNALKTTLLTALKDIVTSRVAAQLFKLVGGDVNLVNPGGAGGGGGFGKLGSLLGLGAIPVFGSNSIAGGPGGTSGFAGPVAAAAGAAGGTPIENPLSNPLGAASQVAGLKGLFGGGSGAAGAASLASLAALGGSLAGGLGAFKLGASHNNVAKGFAIPTGVAAGLLGFGGLVSLFPALLAAGPAGWIAAGAIGGLVGLIGLFKKSAEDKIVKAVKRVYGFEIDRKFAKDSLLPIIQQQFGGDIEAGLRAPQIRQLLELYAMSRGLNSQGIVARATPSVFASRGGSFQQVPTFQNGVQVLAGSSQNTSTAGTTVLQLDANATTQLLQGQAVEAVAANPRVVSRASDQGSTQRANRQAAASVLSPAFIV